MATYSPTRLRDFLYMRIDTQEQARFYFDYHEDGYLVWKNCSDSSVIGKRVFSCIRNKYLCTYVMRVKYPIHRLVFLWHKGYFPVQVDHEDRDKFNNKIDNLRAATQSQNRANCPPRRDGISKYKGVGYRKRKWSNASWNMSFSCKEYGIKIKRHYHTESSAALEYNKFAVKYNKEFAHLNIIQP